MAYKPLKKGTIIIPSGTDFDPDRKHLFVICTDKCENGFQVIVPICTHVNDLCDSTCVIAKGEHRYITKKSYVLYRKSQIIESENLVKGVKSGKLQPHDDMNGQTFLRVKKGLCGSRQTPRKIKKYLGCEEPTAANSPSAVSKPEGSGQHSR
jgi:hypothetical protein